jgi:hypothetical protein
MAAQRRAVAFLVLASWLALREVSAGADEVRVFVPAFESADALGLNVATVLNLQVWQTLRRAPWPNPKGLSFGDGVVIWDKEPLEVPTHAGAERLARMESVSADVVLWGKAYRFGQGVVVQSHLTLSDGNLMRKTRPERWEIRLPTANGSVSLTADLPSHRYTFEPIVLDSAVVAGYSEPSSLKIYSDKAQGRVLGTVGDYFTARQHDGENVLLVSNPGRPEEVQGWVRLPRLSETRTEVVDFAGGLVRILRADWSGARALLNRVVQNGHTPSALKTDSLLCLGLLAEKEGRSGRQPIQQAYDINPLSRSSATFLVMAAFAEYTRAAAQGAPAATCDGVRRIRRLMDDHAVLFPEEDAWFNAARAAYKRLPVSNCAPAPE